MAKSSYRDANFDNLGSNRDDFRYQRHASKINAQATERGKSFLIMAIPRFVVVRSCHLVIRYRSLVLGRIVLEHRHDVSQISLYCCYFDLFECTGSTVFSAATQSETRCLCQSCEFIPHTSLERDMTKYDQVSSGPSRPPQGLGRTDVAKSDCSSFLSQIVVPCPV